MGTLRVQAFRHALEAAARLHSRYKGRPSDCTALSGFLEANGWLEGDRSGDDITIPWDEEHESRLVFWLNAYGKSYEEKIRLLLGKGCEAFPGTFLEYEEFMGGEKASCRSHACVLDFLASSLREELDLYTEKELDGLTKEASLFLNLEDRQTLAAFLNSIQFPGLDRACQYRAEQDGVYKMDTSAYPVEVFSRMEFLVFSDESWKENRLLEKAASSRRTASILAFLSLHFYTGIRAEDMRRLPRPRLSADGEDVRQMILSGEMGEPDFLLLTDCWEQEISSFRRPPNKTDRGALRDDIKVSVPDTLKASAGRILALAASYCEDGDGGWVYGSRVNKRALAAIFCATGWPDIGKAFSTRRANKSFLQGIQSVTEESGMDGYLGPAFFRSHAGSYGHLPPTTELYLRDRSFTGRTPEDILYQLFERGSMGFVLVRLMERIDASTYRSISMEGQTSLIQGLGLKPYQAEDVIRSVSTAMSRARETVSEIFSGMGSGQMADRVAGILEKAASGAGPAMQDHLSCILIAAGRPCPYPDRGSCMGCRAEMYTRSVFYLLVKEYVALKKKQATAGVKEAVRIERILEDGVLVAIEELLQSGRILFQEKNIGPYLTMFERGMQIVRDSI